MNSKNKKVHNEPQRCALPVLSGVLCAAFFAHALGSFLIALLVSSSVALHVDVAWPLAAGAALPLFRAGSIRFSHTGQPLPKSCNKSDIEQ